MVNQSRSSLTGSGYICIHTNNHVTTELIHDVIQEVEKNGGCEVSFDVTGRNKHEVLSHELLRSLKFEKYDVFSYVDGYLTLLKKFKLKSFKRL